VVGVVKAAVGLIYLFLAFVFEAALAFGFKALAFVAFAGFVIFVVALFVTK